MEDVMLLCGGGCYGGVGVYSLVSGVWCINIIQ